MISSPASINGGTWIFKPLSRVAGLYDDDTVCPLRATSVVSILHCTWLGNSIENRDKDNVWIIDPIDGTTNFLHGIPHFAICLALESKKEIISGLIYDPIKDEMFYAEKNKGAYLNNQRLRVSNKNLIDECLFSSNHEGVKFSNLNMRYSGCAALDLAYVASGRLDGFFHNKINIWDVAAGALLVEEAGGIVNNLDKFDQNNIDIRASSGAINDKMLENLRNF